MLVHYYIGLNLPQVVLSEILNFQYDIIQYDLEIIIHIIIIQSIGTCM